MPIASSQRAVAGLCSRRWLVTWIQWPSSSCQRLTVSTAPG